MPGLITAASTVQKLSGGGTITYTGNTSRCIWWALLGVNAGVEGAAYGTLTHKQSITDSSGYATAIYTAPIALGAGQYDRIKVFESQVVS